MSHATIFVNNQNEALEFYLLLSMSPCLGVSLCLSLNDAIIRLLVCHEAGV